MGLKVIIDFVPGHTGIEHPWFKQLALPTPNKYTDCYIWTNGTYAYCDKSKFTFSQGYSHRHGNYLPNYFWHQPALNFGFDKPDPKQSWQLPIDHSDVRSLKAEMWNVMKYWLDMGCDGFRVYMVGSLIKEDESGACGRYWNQITERITKLYMEAILISELSYPKPAVPAGFHADFIHWSPSFQALYKHFRPD